MHSLQRLWIGILLVGCDKTAEPIADCASTVEGCDASGEETGQTTADSADAEVDDSGDDPGPSTDSSEPEDSGRADDSGTSPDTGETPVEPPVNLLGNPGFEDGDEPWSIWGGAQRAAGHALSGEWSLEATEVNGAEQRVEGLLPNTTYRLSGWAKVEGDEPILLGVKDHGGDEVRVPFTDNEYTEGSLTFTTGFAYTSATIYAYKHGGGGAGYADDLVLTYESPATHTLVWSDEFDGMGPVDSSKWTFEEGFVRNEEIQWYQPENAFQEDGMLVIEGQTEDRPNPTYVAGSTDWRTRRETITHTSASITTRDVFEWQYGHLVVRAKVTNLTGTWPAIWTLGTECEWPSNGEVDVMENYGGNILANFAWGTDVRWTPEWDSSHWSVDAFGPGWTDDFHLWEMEWNESRMIIRLDGTVLNDVWLDGTINGSAACEGENPFRQPHYLLLNLALGGAGGSVDDLSFPTRYLVDYVRLYQ